MAARDGQRFEDQSSSTQDAFRAAYGSGAASAWEAEHDRATGGGGSSSSNPADGRDAWVESASQKAKADADRNATSRYASDTSASASRDVAGISAGTSRYVADLNAKTDRYTTDVNAGVNRYGIDTTAKTAANELAQMQRQFDATLAFKISELKQERERIAIERGRAEADKWYQEQQVRLADQTHGLAVSQLGLDYLKTDVEFRSTPDNYFKLADFEAGARARQDVPIFLQNLQNGVQGAAYGAPGGVPTPQGIGSGITALGGSVAPGIAGAAVSGPEQQAGTPGSAVGGMGTEGWSGQDVSALNSIAQLHAQGAHKLSPGALESLSSDNRALIGAGIARIGGSPRAFSESYLRSRPGQKDARLA